jgi:thiamine biosynthesis lipoprotein
MGTVVSFRVVGTGLLSGDDPWAAIERAEAWFQRIEATCSRFEPESELSRLSRTCGRPLQVSPLLYRLVEYALRVAHTTDGAFDPTVGRRMEALGFDRNWRSGDRNRSGPDGGATYRDVTLDPAAGTVALARPLLLDLGAVAKGMAVDLAARELAPLEHFTIDAGGDLYLGGLNENDAPWTVGIRHPRQPDALVERLSVSDVAVCTSGDYDRRSSGGECHIMDPRTGESSTSLASVTVVASSAMVADALATAAFVLGPDAGLALLESQGVEGLLVTPALERVRTRVAAGVMPGQ